MKTDAIRKCLATLKMTNIDGDQDPYSKMREEAQGEIKGIEKDIAVLTKTLDQAIAAIQNAPEDTWGAHESQSGPDGEEQGWWIRDEMVHVFSRDLSSIYPGSGASTGKVLVDAEKLNKLANGFQGTDGFELGLCPVCAKKEFHADDCWLKEYWLKEA